MTSISNALLTYTTILKETYLDYTLGFASSIVNLCS